LNKTDIRAGKDAYNRKKGIAKLEKPYKTGVVNKENINKRRYNKFLEFTIKMNTSQKHYSLRNVD
jgi:hypothetical protein